MSLLRNLKIVLIGLIAFIAFAHSLGGDFVYDDNRQILMNPLIQQPQLYAKALTSDVWAFKGDGTVSASNYYRPVFVFWLIVNFALFGTNPFGWHLMNILLHVTVCMLVFAMLRRFNFSDSLSFVLAALFAVHPAHVENVGWISGSPDILLSLFFISSVLVLFARRGKSNWPVFVLSLLLYGLALGTKEIAMMLFPVYFLVFRSGSYENSDEQTRYRDSLIQTLPFAGLAAAYFIIRWFVIGGVTHYVENAPSSVAAILSVPSVFLFYLRQAIVPVFLAENYPLRPETGFTISFVISSIASAAVLLAGWRLCRGHIVRQIGASLFLLPLLPALFVRSFPSEQIVHDRYLYLPLLGLLIICGSVARDWLPAAPRFRRSVEIAAIAVLALFGIQTIIYERVWLSSFNLWEYNVQADPSSASSFANYASELSSRGRFEDSIKAYDRSLEIKPSALAFMGRGRNLIALRRYDEAIESVNRIIQLPNEEANAYILYQGYEAAAIAYSSSGRLSDAETLLREARERLPIYRAVLTDKLAVVLYNEGKKDDALNQLNSVREQAKRELLPASKVVFFRLGVLESELSDTAAARRDLTEYLNDSSTYSDPESLNLRKQASATLGRLR
jgi:tetratricopeptide (TPR) repeat protein